MPVIQCIVAQWRHMSSESAVQFPIELFQYLLSVLVTTAKYDAQPNCMGYFTCANNCGRKSVQIMPKVATRTKQQL